MKTFNVYLTGLWNFDFLVDAKSKEEAIRKLAPANVP